MNSRRHFIVGLIVATASLFFSQRIPFLKIEGFGVELSVFVLTVAVSVLLDVDHLLDFRVNWNSQYRYMNLEQKLQEGRMFVIFHSFENVLILTVLSIIFPFLVFPTVSYICHVTMDAIGNKVLGKHISTYFGLERNG
jgi:hypothetical protein